MRLHFRGTQMARQINSALLRGGCVSIFAAAAGFVLLTSRGPIPDGARRLAISSIQPVSSASLAAKRQQAAELLRQLPLRFEPTAASAPEFVAKGPGYSIGLSKSEIAIARRVPKEQDARPLEVELLGAHASAKLSGTSPLGGSSNYYVGNDPSQWRTGVPQFARVRYEGLYDGVDAVFYGTPRQLEFDFVVAPYADPLAIRLKFSEGTPLRLDNAGNLFAGAGSDQIQLQRPVIHQDLSGERRLVAGGFAVEGSTIIFRLGDYDRAQPLVIDPVLQYASYLGGSGADAIQSVEVDASGNVFVAGYTTSTDFPIVDGALSNNRGNGDGFIAKLNSTGSTLTYASYLGGAGDDQMTGIGIDGTGSIWVTGFSNSTNFPLQAQLQTVIAGGYDVAVARFSRAGLLQFSTYLGGSGDDKGEAIAIDAASAVYVTGGTLSNNFPTGIAAQVNYGGASASCPTTSAGLAMAGDAFVFKLNSSGATLQYSTYLGGSGCEVGTGIAVDLSGNAYITGATTSSNFPTAGALQNNLGGGSCAPLGGGSYTCPDAFVTKLNSGGTGIVYSTYLGGNSLDAGSGIAVDSTGAAYVVGTTQSANFPLASALKSTLGGTQDAFVAKINAAGTALTFSTYFGGSGADSGSAIKLDALKRPFIVGSTLSGDLPLVKQIQNNLAGNSDVLIATLSPSGNNIDYSTYYGSTGDDYGLGLAIDGSGNIWTGGYTQSGAFPTRGLPLQASSGGGQDGILLKTDGVPGGPAVNAGGVVNNASYGQSTSVAPGSIAAVFGNNLNDGSSVLAPAIDPITGRLATSLGGASVSVNNLAAPLYYSTPGQLGIQIPFEVGTGSTTIQVTVNGIQSPPQSVTISNAAPGLFTTNQAGFGLPAALHASDGVTPLSAANPAHYNELIEFFATGLGVTIPPLATGQFSGANLASLPTLANVGGVNAFVQYSGTAPGFIGLNQINVQIPSGIATGSAVPVVITVGGVPANTVMIPIAQ
jgi:uncharacterized protein (TIGR03437 family)